MPFLKNFTGMERKYIKDEYLAKKDVLEYVLWRVLNMNYYELSEPDACKALLLEYKEVNDPVRQFWSELEEQFVWDFLPYEFIYDVYLKWLDASNPGTEPLGKTTFRNHLKEVVQGANGIWWVPPQEEYMEMCKGRPVKKLRDKNFNRKDMMDKPEMLIKKYRIQDWGDDTYKGGDEARKLIPSPARTQARGLMRFSRAVADGWCDKDGCPIAKRKAPVAQGSVPDMQNRQEPEPAV